VAVSQPAAARQSRGHVTPASASRAFKARVAQGLPYRSHIILTDRADVAALAAKLAPSAPCQRSENELTSTGWRTACGRRTSLVPAVPVVESH